MRTIRVDDEVYELVTRYARLWNQSRGHTVGTFLRLHEQPEHSRGTARDEHRRRQRQLGRGAAVTADIALPEPIDPDAPVIRFVHVSCRCGEKSPVDANANACRQRRAR